MKGILRTSPPIDEGSFEVNTGIVENNAEDSVSYKTAATTVEEFEVNHSSSPGNDGEDEFASNTIATTVEASNVPVRTNAAMGFLKGLA